MQCKLNGELNMSYTNVTHSIFKPAESYVKENMDSSNLSTKAAHLGLAALSFLTTSADSVIGLGAGFGTMLTYGKSMTVYKFSIYHLGSSKAVLLLPYKHLMEMINPEAKFSARVSQEATPFMRYLGSLVEDKLPMITADGNGFISDLFVEPLKDIARTCYSSDNFLKRHVASRLTYALLAISCIVTRAVDGIIGVPAGLLSLVTGGKYESLNNLAYRSLQAPAIINDLTYCAIKVLNPFTGTKAA